ncbi:unnamed protein product [Parnassius apollo]|uniref:(apollo) hypothetical protein n=1 Tax=Parnassius apollo TaxID=110799 RepID=A0A8S3WVH2_PARAO|nr:unnamed protein product [Parnassius apollo]
MADKISFDFKTAINLLPIMNGQKYVTKQLIDGIDMYNYKLDEASKKSLIVFVLKTRLSLSAKLRLSYAAVDSLLSDMRKYLLQKKSAVALQNVKQSHRSIEAFGNLLEDIFSNFTRVIRARRAHLRRNKVTVSSAVKLRPLVLSLALALAGSSRPARHCAGGPAESVGPATAHAPGSPCVL